MNREVFLKQIHLEPEDNDARLIYADWLEELGDPQGEFIRLQIEMDESVEKSPHYEDLNGRAIQIWRDYHEEWENRLPRWLSPNKFNGYKNYNRGFISNFIFEGTKFITNAQEVMDVGPIWKSRILVRDGGKGISKCKELLNISQLMVDARHSHLDFKKFFSSPYIENLRDLQFCFRQNTAGGRSYSRAFGDEEAEFVARSDRLSGLRSLEFDRGPITDAGFERIVTSPNLGNLESLDLRGTQIGVDGIIALATSQIVDQIKQLKFSNQTDASGFRAFFDQERPNFEHFHLNPVPQTLFPRREYQTVGSAALQILFGNAPSLKVMNLGQTKVTGKSLTALMESAAAKSLNEITLSGLSVRDIMLVVKNNCFTNLHYLDLSGCDLTQAAVEEIFQSEMMSQVTQFNLGPLSNKIFSKIDDYENLREIRHLIVGSNREPVSVPIIANSEVLQKLQTLSIEWCPITEKIAKDLANSPYMDNLLELNLFNCGVSKKSKEILKNRFGDALWARN